MIAECLDRFEIVLEAPVATYDVRGFAENGRLIRELRKKEKVDQCIGVPRFGNFRFELLLASFGQASARTHTRRAWRRNMEFRLLGNKGGVKVNRWRKRVGAPNAGEQPLPILFLVQGSIELHALVGS